MKRLGLLAIVALAALGVSAPAASAGPLNGAAKICANQGGTWHPNGFPMFPLPSCDGVELIVWDDQEASSRGSTQLTAVDSVCRAAGFSGFAGFGAPVEVDGRTGFRVSTWACVQSS